MQFPPPHAKITVEAHPHAAQPDPTADADEDVIVSTIGFKEYSFVWLPLLVVYIATGGMAWCAPLPNPRCPADRSAGWLDTGSPSGC